MKHIRLVTLLFFSSLFSFSQSNFLSNNAEVSVLTFGPGENLNDAFGHNAFRIKDKQNRIDVVFGYGQYDFDSPNFYLKFASGKLNYLISKHYFEDIFFYYTQQNRAITSQTLNLSQTEKQAVFDYLNNNYKPENRAYLYDFFYDNCATKIRDITKETTSKNIVFQTDTHANKTFRDLVNDHLNWNSWGSFGVNIALGSVTDKRASIEEFMFLPKHISSIFAKATFINGERLVKTTASLYKTKPQKFSKTILSPLLIFTIIAIVLIYFTFKDFKTGKRTKIIDYFIFSTTGIVGLILCILWFFTDHNATAQNYNVLWASPFNLLFLIALLKNNFKKWFKAYIKFLIIMLALMLLHWTIGVQNFSYCVIPLLFAFLYRYIFLSIHLKPN